jgi:hypothetical protein
MTFNEMINSLGLTGITGIMVILLTLVQVAPVKINPWSRLAKAIGRALNTEVIDEIRKNEAGNARYRIIRFDDEVRHKTRHTEEHFNQIIDDIDMYEAYCTKHPDYENNKARLAIRNIKDTYTKCKRDNSFLV